MINRLLQEDRHSIEKLKNLDGKSFALILSDTPIKIEIHFVNDGLQIMRAKNEHVDVTIKTSSKSILQLMKAKSPLAVQGITLEGDIMIAHKIQNLFKGIQIDWEELLSRFTGDIIANQIGLLVKQFKHRTQSIKERFSNNMVLFLQEEALILPRKEEVDFFMEETDNLRDWVQGLEQRISHLKVSKVALLTGETE
jgi:ubiquinone biosynthesis accessory factor UbiJ